MTAEHATARATRAYVEGLLPQGARRRRIAHGLGVDPGDGYALIAALGRDCPGAVTFGAEGVTIEPHEEEALAWLEEDELAEVSRPLRDRIVSKFGVHGFRIGVALYSLSLLAQVASEL